MGDDGRDKADNPGVVAPPPFIYAGSLVAGLLANRRLRLRFLPRRLARTLGPLLIVCGLVVGQRGFRAVRRAGSGRRDGRRNLRTGAASIGRAMLSGDDAGARLSSACREICRMLRSRSSKRSAALV